MAEFRKKLYDKQGNVKLLYTNVSVREHLLSGYYFEKNPCEEQALPKQEAKVEEKLVVEQPKADEAKQEVAKEQFKKNTKPKKS